MEGIERNLLTKNRDRLVITFIVLSTSFDELLYLLSRFTQNLSVFRRDINDALKGPNVTTTTVNDMMTS